MSEQLQRLRSRPTDWLPEKNPFSGNSYRMVNFIVDFPVRVDELVKLRTGVSLGRTVFAMVEFQVLDRDTARQNEEATFR